MAAGLTIEQMEFLISKGLSGEDMLTFAKMGQKAKSKGAERIARWRAKQKGITPNETPDNVTRNVTCNALPPPIEDHTPPVSSSEETRPPRKTKSASLAKPDGVRDQVWQDFTAHRKRRRADVTELVIDGIRAEAAKVGWTLDAALAEIVTRGWQSFKADWVVSARAPPANDGASGDLVRSILAN